jgi:hypothetical protein
VGLAMQDVAYLLWTSVDPAVLQQHEDELLDYYILELLAQLKCNGINVGDAASASTPPLESAPTTDDGAGAGAQIPFPSLLRRQYEVLESSSTVSDGLGYILMTALQTA